MRILLLKRAFNSLNQRLFVDLKEDGYSVAVEYDISDSSTERAIGRFAPDAIVASFVTRRIPRSSWSAVPTFVVHPGPIGDRGPSALDWAVLDGFALWGVTVLQADEGLDTGPVWSSRTFEMRSATKGSLYRDEVTDAASICVREALAAFRSGRSPISKSLVNLKSANVAGWRPRMRPEDRRIDWSRDDTATVLRKIRSADGRPGLRDELLGRDFLVFDAHEAFGLLGSPGEVVARSGGAVGRVTIDGGVWIGRLCPMEKGVGGLKMSAVTALGEDASGLPARPSHFSSVGEGHQTIRYVEDGPVGYVHFDFHNGAMSTNDCRRLMEAYLYACSRPTRVVVLMGGDEFWSNGIDLVSIEAAEDPASESWWNINAIDDISEAIVTTTHKLVVAAMRGNAGAGGVFLACAADRVLARDGVVFNPHYKNMGDLHGSELWTYLMPRRMPYETGKAMMDRLEPVGTAEAMRTGLVDRTLPGDRALCRAAVAVEAAAFAKDPDLQGLLDKKAEQRALDESRKPLAHYRMEELEKMARSFFGADQRYHSARQRFVYKERPEATPEHLAVDA